MDRAPKSNKTSPEPQPPVLGALGLGPDTLLMNDPKLFLDGRFLGALMAELEGELGEVGMQNALFQVGLTHGFRDALRVTEGPFFSESGPPAPIACEATSPLMQLSANAVTPGRLGLEITGLWPEQHEAHARLSRLGVTTSPSCYLSAGYTSGWLSGTQDRDIIALEEDCCAARAPQCTFRALEIADWSSRPQAGLVDRLRLPSFETFRQLARENTLPTASNEAKRSPGHTSTSEGRFDPADDAVHIWGPVAILPLTQIDEALATVEMLTRDPSTSTVRVVVLDLRGQALDEGLDAAALEQLLDIIESWGAEAILTGVSVLAETAVRDLESAHLLTRKDLPEAIAAAFQIAEAQRHLL
jgi:hypothetical protein